MAEPQAQATARAARGPDLLRVHGRSARAAAVVAEADAIVSKGKVGAELCREVRRAAAGRRDLPRLPPRLAESLRRRLGHEEQAIFGMLLAELAPAEVATTLGVSPAGWKGSCGNCSGDWKACRPRREYELAGRPRRANNPSVGGRRAATGGRTGTPLCTAALADGGNQRPARDRGGRLTISVFAPGKISVLALERRGDRRARGRRPGRARQRVPGSPRGRSGAAVTASPRGRLRESRPADSRRRADLGSGRARADLQRDARAPRARAAGVDRSRAPRARGRATPDRSGAARSGRSGAHGGAARPLARLRRVPADAREDTGRFRTPSATASRMCGGSRSS